jgi:seryl-tRNA synthetase
MIDIKLIRENPELVKENIKKKFQDHKLKLVDEVLAWDQQIKELKSKGDALRHRRNILSEEINKLKKEGQNISERIAEVKNIPQHIKEIEESEAVLAEKMRSHLLHIPNIINALVPLGRDGTENVEQEKIGHYKFMDFEPKSHVEIAEHFGIGDFESSAKTSGNGFYFLMGELATLNQALIRFGIDFMMQKGYRLIEPPLMIRKDICEGVVDFDFFQNMAYKIDGEDLYLIATSEHPMIGMLINKTIKEDDLPVKHTAYSMCFRKEIGSHGIDEKGLFRTHQFNKVEMIVVCRPEESMQHFYDMKNITIDIFKELEIPIRVLDICSGDLGDLKHCQVDIEAWSPRKKEYYEIGSCSNLTDAQARRLNIKITTKTGEKYYPHTLNNTAIATSRAMVAIMENYQNADGSITVPKVLQPYMHGIKKIGKK